MNSTQHTIILTWTDNTGKRVMSFEVERSETECQLLFTEACQMVVDRLRETDHYIPVRGKIPLSTADQFLGSFKTTFVDVDGIGPCAQGKTK